MNQEKALTSWRIRVFIWFLGLLVIWWFVGVWAAIAYFLGAIFFPVITTESTSPQEIALDLIKDKEKDAGGEKW